MKISKFIKKYQHLITEFETWYEMSYSQDEHPMAWGASTYMTAAYWWIMGASGEEGPVDGATFSEPNHAWGAGHAYWMGRASGKKDYCAPPEEV